MPIRHSDDLERLRERLAGLVDVLGIEPARARRAELAELAASPDLWDDPERARGVTTELARLEQEVGRVESITSTLDDLEVLDELAYAEDDE